VEAGKSASEGRAGALITVVNGGLELENAVINIAAADKSAVPRTAISVTNGDLVLYRCRVQGPFDPGGRTESLLRWSRDDQAASPPRRPFEAPRDGYLVLYESFLLGSGRLIDADLRRRALFIHHSVAVSTNDLLSIGAAGVDSQVQGGVDLRQSTFSAGDTLFRLNLAEIPAGGAPTLEMFADRCVFAPALRPEKQRGMTTMMSFAKEAAELGLITWWESHCGYATEVGCFVRAADEAPQPQDFESVWRGHWGQKNVNAPLLGAQGVVLKTDLPTKPGDRNRLEPINLALHPSCKASTWDHGEGQIGALVDQMQVPSPTADTGSKSAASKKSKGGTKRAPPPVQGF
jgi:hypothetical protein